jgi:hypothetical protein
MSGSYQTCSGATRSPKANSRAETDFRPSGRRPSGAFHLHPERNPAGGGPTLVSPPSRYCTAGVLYRRRRRLHDLIGTSSRKKCFSGLFGRQKAANHCLTTSLNDPQTRCRRAFPKTGTRRTPRSGRPLSIRSLLARALCCRLRLCTTPA